MRNGILTWSLLGIAALCGTARAEIFEVPLPVAGTYEEGDFRTFEVVFGTAFSEIREARFYVEGTMVAPLRGPLGNPPYTPVDGWFQALLDQPSSQFAVAHGPRAGEGTYPAPEPFAGEDDFAASVPVDWGSLLDGNVSGSVVMVSGPVGGNFAVVGGTGVITRASLILDATAVPEPGVFWLVAIFLSSAIMRPNKFRRRTGEYRS